jgi:Cu/Ag efflux pump CusA
VLGVEPVAQKMLPLEVEEGHIMSLTAADTIEVDESVRTILRERARRRVMVLFTLLLTFGGFAALISLMYLD